MQNVEMRKVLASLRWLREGFPTKVGSAGLAVVALLALVACGGLTPLEPSLIEQNDGELRTLPSGEGFRLSGSVQDGETGCGLAATEIEAVDEEGRSWITESDEDGRYGFDGRSPTHRPREPLSYPGKRP